MGRLIPLKALDVSLRAISLVRDEGLDVSIDILGDGPERPGLEALVNELGPFRPMCAFTDFARRMNVPTS